MIHFIRCLKFGISRADSVKTTRAFLYGNFIFFQKEKQRRVSRHGPRVHPSRPGLLKHLPVLMNINENEWAQLYTSKRPSWNSNNIFDNIFELLFCSIFLPFQYILFHYMVLFHAFVGKFKFTMRLKSLHFTSHSINLNDYQISSTFVTIICFAENWLKNLNNFGFRRPRTRVSL